MGLPSRGPSRGAISSAAAPFANSMKPRSLTVIMAAGLVSTSPRNRSCAAKVALRFCTSSTTNNPQQMRASASSDSRVRDGGSPLNTSARIAQADDSKAVAHRGRNPAASMIGNTYRNPREMKGLTHQSSSAIVKMIPLLSANTSVRRPGSQSRSNQSVFRFCKLAHYRAALRPPNPIKRVFRLSFVYLLAN